MMRNSKAVSWGGMLALGLLVAACAGAAGPAPTASGDRPVAATTTTTAQADAVSAVVAAQPTATGTPYVRPTDDPGVDPERVIATVAGHAITVEEFRNRVRYERWSMLDTLRRILEIAGLDAINVQDTADPLTVTLINYLYPLENAEAFAGQVLEAMLRERIVHQEFVERGLQPNTALLNNLWARLLEIEEASSGSLPDDFDARLGAFMDDLGRFTDIRELDLRFMLTVRSEYQAVEQAVGSEVAVDLEQLDVRQIVVSTEAEAEEIVALLNEGADFTALAEERSIDPGTRSSGGDLGYFGRGQMIPEFEEAVFEAEPGQILGPLQTRFGYHVVEVLDQEAEVRLRRILVETAEEAEAALARLEAGEDFAALVEALSIDPEAQQTGGDMGYLAPGDAHPALEPVFVAEVGDIIGPVETEAGFSIVEVTERRVGRVRARHILVASEEEAEATLARLEAGEDFAALAAALSLDPGVQGSGGRLGFVVPSQLPQVLAEAVRQAEGDEIIGPVQTRTGYHVLQVTDRRPNIPTPREYDELRAAYFQNWLSAQAGAVEVDPIWREVYPSDPRPIDYAPYLGELAAQVRALLETPPATSATG